MTRIKIAEDDAIDVAFSAGEISVLQNRTQIGSELIQRLDVAAGEGDRKIVSLTLYDLEDMLDFIAAEANHTTDSSLRHQLRAVALRLQSQLESYDDGNWQYPE